MGNVETVVGVEDLEDALAFATGESEEVHGGIVHTEKGGKVLCFLSLEKMGMGRTMVTISASEEVEVELTVDS